MPKRTSHAFLSLLLTTNADGSDKRKLLVKINPDKSSGYISVQYDEFVLFAPCGIAPLKAMVVSGLMLYCILNLANHLRYALNLVCEITLTNLPGQRVCAGPINIDYWQHERMPSHKLPRF